MNAIIEHAERLLWGANRSAKRTLVAIAGIPGSGKSTLAAALASALNSSHNGIAMVLPMDGFHFTNAELDERGLRAAKGSPHTFDLAAYKQLLTEAVDMRNTPSFPIYDRQLHDPVWRPNDPAQRVAPETRIIIGEGNYLLLDQLPWSELAALFSETWMIDTPPDVAKDRIIARHVKGGRDADDATNHYENVDGPNAQLIIDRSLPADVIFPWEECPSPDAI